MKAEQLIENLALQLGDFDKNDASNSYVRWSKELLASYISDAYCMIAAIAPAEFVTTSIVKLQPGSTQNTCCSLVGNTVEFTDAAGTFIARVIPVKAPPTWRGATSSSDCGYKPLSTYRASMDPTTFEIFPPVPATGSYYVKIRCTQPPAELTAANWATELPKCKYTAAVTEWAMYRALSGENDTALGNLAGLHYKAYMDIMGQQAKVAKAFAQEGA